LAYAPDGRYLIAGHQNGKTKTIYLIEAKTLQVADLVRAGDRVYNITVHPKSTYFAAGAGKQLVVWSLPVRR